MVYPEGGQGGELNTQTVEPAWEHLRYLFIHYVYTILDF